MGSSKSRRRRKKPDPTASLPDDIVVDILSRLPVRSLYRCKAVSRRWRALISHDDHRRTLARTLPGLFYDTVDSRRFPSEARHFTHVWEGDRHPLVYPSLPFMPLYGTDATVLDCCNGILLCRFSQSIWHDDFRYVVCNPVERTRIDLPDSGCGAKERVARLAFDLALYPKISVFEFVKDEDGDVLGANIYSSVTGAWSYKESGWSHDVCLFDNARCALFKGYLHLFSTSAEVLVVDVEGDSWRTIRLPVDADRDCAFPGFIGVCKEQLCYIGEMEGTYDLSIWILEDYTNGDWINKRQLSIDMLYEKQLSPHKSSSGCHVIGILQDCNFLLYVVGRTLMVYDIDGEQVHAIQNLEQGIHPPFFLYVPFYTVIDERWAV